MGGVVGALEGRRVVVTRPREQAAEFVAALERRGAEAIVVPAIRISGPADAEPLRRAARDAGGYDWIVFTSTNGVRRFWEVREALGLGPESLEGVRFGCVGPATAAELAARGIDADVVPPRYVGEAVVEAVAEAQARLAAAADAGEPLAGIRVLLPIAAGARPVVAEGLEARGATVDRVEAYRTVPDLESAAALRRRLDRGEVDAVTFTSSSTVEGFVAGVGTELGRAIAAAIGPVTARTARRCGLRVAVVAEEHTVDGLVEALARYFGAEPAQAGGV